MRSKDPELMKEICAYIDRYYKEKHRGPTQREIAKAVGISSSSANRYVMTMAEMGMITCNKGKAVGTEEIQKCSPDFATPIVGSIPCGDPEEETEMIESYVRLPEYIFGKGEFYILHAEGTSMVDAGIQPGDLVVIRRQETADKGDIVVVLDDQNRNTLKKYDGLDPDTGKAILLYQNEEEYPNMRILVDELVVQGVATDVIKHLRSNKRKLNF